MTKFDPQSTFTTAPRFRVLVNGFSEGKCFPTLALAKDSVPAKGAEGLSFEIYDLLDRCFVWSQPKQIDSRSHPGAFSIRVNGHTNGLSFVSLAETADYISMRPPGKRFAVYEDEVRVYNVGYSQSPERAEAS